MNNLSLKAERNMFLRSSRVMPLWFFLSLGLTLLQPSTECNDIITNDIEGDIVGRNTWSAKLTKSEDYMQLPVQHLFIHHTAMAPCNNFSACSQMMRTIQDLHMEGNKWDDIGYNFLIGGDGKVYEGRGWNRVGAHTYGYNRIAIAFSLMGNYVETPPSDLMLNVTQAMINYAYDRGYLARNFTLHGHRDAGCTECPGQALYDIIRTWPRFQGGPLSHYSCRSGK